MRKANKIMMMTVSILLCLVLVTSSVMSSTLAKYVTTGDASSSTARVAKWGITVESGTDLRSNYTLSVDLDGDGTVDEINAVQSSENVIAPGTQGCLAWVRVKGTPEVAYNVDFTGSISIGDGYYESSGLIRNSSGTAIDYFPVIIYLIAYDVKAESEGTLTLEFAGVQNTDGKNIKYGLANYRKNSSTDKIQNDYIFTSKTDSNDQVRASFSLTTLNKVLNGTYDKSEYDHMAVSEAFDHSGTVSTAVDRVYAVQWCWPYNHADNNYLFSSEKQEGNTGGFLKREYDTQIAEAIANGSTAFNVTADLDVDVTQADPS